MEVKRDNSRNQRERNILFLDDKYATPEYALKIEKSLREHGIESSVTPTQELGEALDLYNSHEFDFVASDYNVRRGNYNPIERIPESEMNGISEKKYPKYGGFKDKKEFWKYAKAFNQLPEVIKNLKYVEENNKNLPFPSEKIENIEEFKNARTIPFRGELPDSLYSEGEPQEIIPSLPLLYKARKDGTPYSIVTGIHSNGVLENLYRLKLIDTEEFAVEIGFRAYTNGGFKGDKLPMPSIIKMRKDLNSRVLSTPWTPKVPEQWTQTIISSLNREGKLEKTVME